MTRLEIAKMIQDIGLPWRYDHFTTVPQPPYVVYYYPGQDDFMADDSNYVGKVQLFIELYSTDRSSEATVEAQLTSNKVTFYKTTDYIEEEKVYMTTYESEVIINGQ